MTVGLFIPCYVDQFYPDVAIATLELLERFGVDVEFPSTQTCCGQPMANTGCNAETAPVAHRFVEIFADYDHVVCPSGSCVSMVKHHYAEYFLEEDPAYLKLQESTYELCEYLYGVLAIRELDVRFPHRVSLHQSCHGLRELKLAASSECMTPRVDKVRELMSMVDGIQWCEVDRPDECCGFGGTFAVNEHEVSAAMGRDRITDHMTHQSEVIVSADMSCLMHLQGLIRRESNPIRVMHVAQVLAGRSLDPLSSNALSSNAVPSDSVPKHSVPSTPPSTDAH